MSNYIKSVYYTIPYYDRYGINTNGTVIEKQTGKIVDRFIQNDQLCVILDNEVKMIAHLMLSTFIGPLPGMIYFKDDDPTNCKTDNIGYLLNIQWVNDLSWQHIMIPDIILVKMVFYLTVTMVYDHIHSRSENIGQ